MSRQVNRHPIPKTVGFSLSESARRLGITVSSVWKAVDRGRLDAICGYCRQSLTHHEFVGRDPHACDASPGKLKIQGRPPRARTAVRITASELNRYPVSESHQERGREAHR